MLVAAEPRGGGGWVRLEVALLTEDALRPAVARMWNLEAEEPVAGSEVASRFTSFPELARPLWQRVARKVLSLVGVDVFPVWRHIQFLSSRPFRLPENRMGYVVQFGGEECGVYRCYGVRLVDGASRG
jgi:hypothetical protein